MESGLLVFNMLNEDLLNYYRYCSQITKSSQNVEEKNLYFNRSNGYGIFLINNCRYQEAEIFYTQCLNIIKYFEISHKIILSKGMPLVNLGISQIGLGKIEEGVSNIISSFNNDKKYYENPEYEKFYLQFENQIIDKVLFLFINDESVNDYSEKYRDFIKSLGYKIENRLFQFLILNKIYSSYNSYKNNNDISSKLVLFNTLRDQCLLIEQILRDLGVKGDHYTNLLQSEEMIKNYDNIKSNDITEFNSNLENLLSLKDGEEKIFKLSLCIRNFNNHHFDISSKVLYDNISEIIKLTIIKAGKFVGEKMILMMNK